MNEKTANGTRFTQKESIQKYSTFADDQVIIADSQDNLRRVFALQNTTTKFIMEISEISQTVACIEQHPVRCKIVVDNKCLEHVENCKYLGCEIPMKMKRHSIKISKFAYTLGILNNTLKPSLVQNFQE